MPLNKEIADLIICQNSNLAQGAAVSGETTWQLTCTYVALKGSSIFFPVKTFQPNWKWIFPSADGCVEGDCELSLVICFGA